MKANEVIKKVLDEHGEITEVYWVACGGSLIDLYPFRLAYSQGIPGCYAEKAGQAQPGCDVQPFRQYEGGCGGRCFGA